MDATDESVRQIVRQFAAKRFESLKTMDDVRKRVDSLLNGSDFTGGMYHPIMSLRLMIA